MISSSRFRIRTGLLVLFVALAGIAGFSGLTRPAHGKSTTSAWDTRCATPKGGTKTCEVFQEITVAKTGQRVVEMAVSFPDASHDKAIGALILPLGILLTDDLVLKVDDRLLGATRARFCTNAGCFAYIDFDKKALSLLTDGRKLTVAGHVHTGENLMISLQLQGFAPALKKL